MPPDPARWNALDEETRMDLVRRYHRRAGIKLPNERLHAVLHVVVENQVALGDEIPVAAALDRLMREGLDRHDAIHAVAEVLAGHIHRLMADRPEITDEVNQPYYDELAAQTAERWRNRG